MLPKPFLGEAPTPAALGRRSDAAEPQPLSFLDVELPASAYIYSCWFEFYTQHPWTDVLGPLGCTTASYGIFFELCHFYRVVTHFNILHQQPEASIEPYPT